MRSYEAREKKCEQQHSTSLLSKCKKGTEIERERGREREIVG